MIELIERIGDWYWTISDTRMFQFFSGIILGIMIMGAIWLICNANKSTDDEIIDEGDEDDGTEKGN